MGGWDFTGIYMLCSFKIISCVHVCYVSTNVGQRSGMEQSTLYYLEGRVSFAVADCSSPTTETV